MNLFKFSKKKGMLFFFFKSVLILYFKNDGVRNKNGASYDIIVSSYVNQTLVA